MKLAGLCPLCGKAMEGGRFMVAGPHPERTIVPDNSEADPTLEAHFHPECVRRKFGPEYLWPLYQEGPREGEEIVKERLLELALEQQETR